MKKEIEEKRMEDLYFNDYPAFIDEIVKSAVKDFNKEEKRYRAKLKGNSITLCQTKK